MRLRNIPGSKELISSSRYVVQEAKKRRGRWKEYMDGRKELHIEIGMGKGQFLMDKAKENPQIYYLGVEMYDSVLLRAIQKRERIEELPNLFYLRVDARELPEIFGPGEVDKIYLNFSDPWPKERHAKRRLTARQFLDRYGLFLKKGGEVEFKTDNRNLFIFSLQEAREMGWEIALRTFDLHKDPLLVEGNVMTEYEAKFSAEGIPICKAVFISPPA